MPRNGAQTLSDILVDGIDRVYIGCKKCGREGSHSARSLIAGHGMEKGVFDIVAEYSGDCSRRTGQGRASIMGAVYRHG